MEVQNDFGYTLIGRDGNDSVMYGQIYSIVGNKYFIGDGFGNYLDFEIAGDLGYSVGDWVTVKFVRDGQ